MEIKRQIQSFLSLYQTAGWMMLLLLAGLVTQGLIWLILEASGNEPGMYEKFMEFLILPSVLRDFIYKPWTLVTYAFFWDNAGMNLLRILFDAAFIWLFVRIYQQLIGDQGTHRILTLCIPVIGLLSVLICGIIPIDGKGLIPISGITPVMVFMAVACATLVPDYPIQLFLLGKVKIKWIVMVLVAIELASVAFTPPGLAVALGALFGFLHIQMLKKGTDVTELVWSYYQDKTTRTNVSNTKMRVKYGGKFTATSEETRKKRVYNKKDGKVSQDVIDTLLDKISEKGYDSLSREEKEMLFKASSQKEDDKNK